MSASHVGRLLLGLGMLVGAAASVALLIGFEPARLPPALLNVAVYKLVFASALAILAAGAVVSRHARRGEDGRGGVHGSRPRSVLRPHRSETVPPPQTPRARAAFDQEASATSHPGAISPGGSV